MALRDKLPDEVIATFDKAASEAMEALKRRLFISQNRGEIVASIEYAINEVYLPAVELELKQIAAREFERLGRDYVRKVVLETFDRFIEG